MIGQNQQRPAAQDKTAGALPPYRDGSKVMNNIRGFHLRRLYNLLSDGRKYSAADIAVALHMSDPRAAIRSLRFKGIDICDEWCVAEHGGRYKRYFIERRPTLA